MVVDKRRTQGYVFTYYELYDTATIPYERIDVSVYLDPLKAKVESVIGHSVIWRTRIDGRLISGTRYIIVPRDARRKRMAGTWDG